MSNPNPQLPATCPKCGNDGYITFMGTMQSCPDEFHKREVTKADTDAIYEPTPSVLPTEAKKLIADHKGHRLNVCWLDHPHEGPHTADFQAQPQESELDRIDKLWLLNLEDFKAQLTQLLEATKREGAREELELTLSEPIGAFTRQKLEQRLAALNKNGEAK